MTQQDKELLLKDLCARLPYHPIVSVAYNYANKGIVWEWDVLRIKLLLEIEKEGSWEYIKPYLRSMSSMTGEERKEYNHLIAFSGSPDGAANFINWLLESHFDFMGLIPKDLAIEVDESNNPYEQNNSQLRRLHPYGNKWML